MTEQAKDLNVPIMMFNVCESCKCVDNAYNALILSGYDKTYVDALKVVRATALQCTEKESED